LGYGHAAKDETALVYLWQARTADGDAHHIPS